MGTVWWVVSLLIAIVLLYSVIPNIFTRWLHIGVIYKGPVQPVVSLTFDDGPDPRYTPQLLDALRQAGVSATFFVIADKALRHREIVERMLSEGHNVEVHGYRHLFVPWLPPSTTLRQALTAAAAVEDQFGIQVRFYRPTWGLCNAVSWLPRVRRRLRLITWSIMVGDWRVTPAQELLTRIVTQLHKGAIIVLHDSDETFGAQLGAPENVVQLIPELVSAVRQRGYEFRTVAEWL
ncbi:polysaccharide deacetylase family protein [Alicyclobacillus sp. ALC3]|uniref:polysaccharide deacetylase family protein n=1 Tax=Alicyclobacillus sp. ALC3 TaxID=2796143 RepID=UPI0023783348|nr:polysaccharide deacetylase family protein [Alicyclobacillus sp. ALC3]WDL96837.1 polysaccharide deacetylase family protein [Alicyclobacillus sp. ALC3]